MTFNGIMNSPLLYGLVGLGIAYIILFCLITLKKAYKHALELGITREKLKLVITSLRHLFCRSVHFHRHRPFQPGVGPGRALVLVPPFRGGLCHIRADGSRHGGHRNRL